MMDASVLAVYVEPSLVDRRVVFVGDARGEALLRVERAAERVLAFDTSPERRSGRLSNGTIEPFDPYELEALEVAADVVFVPDVRVLGGRYGDRFDDFARLVGRRGVVIVGLGTDDESPYYEDVWDALAVRFDAVRMAGAAPMHAYAVAELGPDETSGVVVDGSLVKRRARTQAFVALAGQNDPTIDGYVLVQVDAPPVADEGARARVSALEEELRSLGRDLGAARSALTGAQAERDRARSEREAQRGEHARLEHEAREAKDAAQKLRKQLASLEDAAKSGPSIDELRKLEERLAEQAERTQGLEAEVERRGRLVRELVEETRDRPGTGDSAELDRALERALKAEAERAEAAFLVDELRARLAERGDVRGTSLSSSERDLSTQLGQLSAQLMMTRERELDARGARDLARGENLALVAQVAALETQHRELRDRVAEALRRLSGEEGSADSVETALAGADDAVERLRGECRGLRMRLDAVEAQRPRGDASREAAALRLENEALAADLADAKSAARRAGDVGAATRDALVERLQLELAEQERRAREAVEKERSLAAEVHRLREAIVEASGSVDAHDALSRRIAQLERDLHDAIGAAEKAAADAREQGLARQRAEQTQHAALVTETTRARAAELALAETRTALEETRALLEELRNAAEAAPAPRRRATDLDTEAGDGSPRPEDDDKDLLVRSLSGQLEERDDRIRALERRLAGSAPSAVGDEEALRRELLDLQERVVRLSDELRVEREARRQVEDRGQAAGSLASSMVARELERTVQQKSQALDEAQARAEGMERDVRALRDVFAETRQGLEHLLGATSGSGDPELAARVGELLTLLGRY